MSGITMRGFALACGVLLLACAREEPSEEQKTAAVDEEPATMEAQSRPAPLVGTWRVVRFCDQDSTGASVDPLGPSPTGYFVYTTTGQLSIQVMRTPPAGPLVGEPIRVSSLGELRPFYFGYFGTYTILSDSTLVHHVQGGTLPDYVGTDQFRSYSIRGDTLSIGAPPFPCRVLIRAR